MKIAAAGVAVAFVIVFAILFSQNGDLKNSQDSLSAVRAQAATDQTGSRATAAYQAARLDAAETAAADAEGRAAGQATAIAVFAVDVAETQAALEAAAVLTAEAQGETISLLKAESNALASVIAKQDVVLDAQSTQSANGQLTAVARSTQDAKTQLTANAQATQAANGQLTAIARSTTDAETQRAANAEATREANGRATEAANRQATADAQSTAVEAQAALVRSQSTTIAEHGREAEKQATTLAAQRTSIAAQGTTIVRLSTSVANGNDAVDDLEGTVEQGMESLYLTAESQATSIALGGTGNGATATSELRTTSTVEKSTASATAYVRRTATPGQDNATASTGSTLAGQLGSTTDDFLAIRGEPDEKGETNDGTAYLVWGDAYFGFIQVFGFYANERVINMRVPVRPDYSTQDGLTATADEMLAVFGPSDANCGAWTDDTTSYNASNSEDMVLSLVRNCTSRQMGDVGYSSFVQFAYVWADDGSSYAELFVDE